MKAVISVEGIFHAFTMAEKLNERDSLQRIYTTFPRFALNTSLPREYVHPIRHPEAVMHLGVKWPILNDIIPSVHPKPLEVWKALLFDRAVARNLQPVDEGIFTGFSSCSLRSLGRATDLGFTTVVERSSSHIETQASILEAEYERYGIDAEAHAQPYVDRVCREFERADYISVPSTFAYESMIDHGVPEEKLLLIPFGTTVPESQYEPEDDTVYFLFSGHSNFRKGILYLLEAWPRLDLEDAELIVTSGIDDEIQPFLEPYRADDSIHFLGYVDDLQEWFHKAAVFVFPSLEEGSARVTYEAMAAGLPLITTHNSGWVGTDGEHGIEVPIRDSEALADAMDRLYHEESERRRMGAASRALIERDYTVEDYGARVYEAYQEIV